MRTKAFWIDLGERAVATFAQALGALLVAAGTGLLDTDYVSALSVAGMAALLAVLKGVAAVLKNKDTGASFGTAVPVQMVAAVEEQDSPTGYESAPAAEEFEQGTPVSIEENH